MATSTMLSLEEYESELETLFKKLSTRTRLESRVRETKEEDRLVNLDISKPIAIDKGCVVYTSKGPVRKPLSSSNNVTPYDRLTTTTNSNLEGNKNVGLVNVLDYHHFDLPIRSNLEENNASTLYFVAKKKNSNNEAYVAIECHLKLLLDDVAQRLALFVPNIRLNSSKMMVSKTSSSLKTLVRLSPNSPKLLQLELSASQMQEGQQVVLEEQMVALCPFQGGSSVKAVIEAGDPRDIYDAQLAVSRKTLQELCRPVSSSADTLLMALCGQTKKDTVSINEAKILALVKRMLWSSVWSEVCRKNVRGTSALEYACISNKHRVVRLLMELTCLLGGDMFANDSNGNNILHLMARKGDKVVETLQTILDLTFHNGKKVISPLLSNRRGELPLHIVCMNNEYHPKTLDALLRSMSYEHCGQLDSLLTNDGSSVLNLACQSTSDPQLLQSLLRVCADTLINVPRDDGLAPLHLVAARGDEEHRQVGLRPLTEAIQLEMVRLLLDHGADRLQTVEGYYPFHLVRPDRRRVRRLLRPERHGSSSSSLSSPSSKASPTPSLNAINDYDDTDDFDSIISDLCKHPIIQKALESATVSTVNEEENVSNHQDNDCRPGATLV